SGAIAIGAAFRAGRSPTRKPTRACSTACWPASAAPSWSAPRRSSRPAPSTGRRNDRPMLRLTSLALFFATWLVGSALAGQEMLPGPVAVGGAILGEARSGGPFLPRRAALARGLRPFPPAMTLGTRL